MKTNPLPNAAAVRARLRIVLDGVHEGCAIATQALVSQKTDRGLLEELDYLLADVEELCELVGELEQHDVVTRE